VPVEVLLWDFGDTLVNEQWMRQAPPEYPEWARVWNEVMETCAADWDTGRTSEREVFAEMSRRSGLAADFVEQHADACCRAITFHPIAWQTARARHRPQALVTVNCDLFLDRVSRRHRLADHFDAIVVSCLEGTTDKTALCDLALERLGFTGERSGTPLIDNRRDLTDAWTEAGGVAYHYVGDASFGAAWPGVLE
jgi:FMN phosphatase YigB (HAD superfamily)